METWETWRDIPADKLALQLAGRKDLDAAFVVRQVEGWQRLRTKVPRWAETPGLRYPHRLALEQCSGQAAAEYKAEVVADLLRRAEAEGAAVPRSMADLTGGLGVDFSFIAPAFAEATYVERQEELCDLARHNFPLLGLAGAKVVCGDGVDYLKHMEPVGLLFLDPARRDGAGRKTVRMEDCEPDVCALLPLLLAKARWTVLKLSPMLDISGALAALGCVREVHVVSVGGECKDLLLVLSQPEGGGEVRVTASHNGIPFRFSPTEETEALPRYATQPAEWLYEPGAALLKAGCFKLIATRFGLEKLHPHSHLYTSRHFVENFPGRCFRVAETLGFGKQDLRRLRSLTAQANLTVRNFPSTVDALRRKLKLREGGSDYLFATTLADGSHALVLGRREEDGKGT